MARPKNLTAVLYLRLSPEHLKRLDSLVKAWSVKRPEAIRRAVIDSARAVEKEQQS